MPTTTIRTATLFANTQTEISVDPKASREIVGDVVKNIIRSQTVINDEASISLAIGRLMQSPLCTQTQIDALQHKIEKFKKTYGHTDLNRFNALTFVSALEQVLDLNPNKESSISPENNQ